MRAIGIMTVGGPDVLQAVELPVPEAGPGEVRIRVHAAAVNPTDLLFRSGGGQAQRLGDRRPPFVPGMDAAADLVRSLGADLVVARGDGIAAAIRAIVPTGVDGLFDAAAQEQLVLAAITDGGGLVEFRGWDGPDERGITIYPIIGLLRPPTPHGWSDCATRSRTAP